MTATDWKELEKAYITIQNTSQTRIETPYWIIYKVGINIIRIDIKVS